MRKVACRRGMVGRLRAELGFHGMLVGTSLLMAADGVRAELGRLDRELRRA